MAPNSSVDEGLEVSLQSENYQPISKAAPRKYEIVYRNIFVFGYLHYAAFYGLYLCFTDAKWQSILFGKCFNILFKEPTTFV